MTLLRLQAYGYFTSIASHKRVQSKAALGTRKISDHRNKENTPVPRKKNSLFRKPVPQPFPSPLQEEEFESCLSESMDLREPLKEIRDHRLLSRTEHGKRVKARENPDLECIPPTPGQS